MSLKISGLSIEYLKISVTAEADVRSFPVYVCLKPSGDPAPSEWNTAQWDPSATDPYIIRYLLDGSQLTKGRYYVWVKIEGPVEKPVAKVGVMEIF